MPPSDVYVRSFLCLLYTWVKLDCTKVLSAQASSLARSREPWRVLWLSHSLPLPRLPRLLFLAQWVKKPLQRRRRGLCGCAPRVQRQSLARPSSTRPFPPVFSVLPQRRCRWLQHQVWFLCASSSHERITWSLLFVSLTPSTQRRARPAQVAVQL